MPVAVVVGGQFGSEGKGKTTAHLCLERGFDAAVRCGGPNSGHTVTINNRQVVLRQIPAGVVRNDTRLFLAAGCLIDLDVLFKEIEMFNLTPDRLRLDRNAAIIEDGFDQEEKAMRLDGMIGSTCTGTGLAVAKRVLRTANLRLARDVPELAAYVANVSDEVMKFHVAGRKIVIEGTQGFGLSVYHSPHYPFTTSRDTAASGFLSEVGISPRAISEIIMVIRTFPIRVGGNSGPLRNEIDWKTVQAESGYPHEIQEYTSVTRRPRRVARFDLDIVRSATSMNMPTQIALMGVDYLDYKNKGTVDYGELTQKARNFVTWLETELGVRVGLIGTGPKDSELLNRPEKSSVEVKVIEEGNSRTERESISQLSPRRGY